MTARQSLVRFYLYAIGGGLQFTYTTWLAFVVSRSGNPGWAEAAFHLAIWFGEIPTGVVADLFGRKKSMITGLLLEILSLLGWFLIQDTFTACLVMGLSGLAGTFLSGADTALLYETAARIGGSDLARRAMARTAALQLCAFTAAPVIGGLLYEWQAWGPAVARAAVALMMVLVVWGMVEQRSEPDFGKAKPEPVSQARAGLAILIGNRATLSLVLLGWGWYTASSLVHQFGQALFPSFGMSMALTGTLFTIAGLASALGGAAAERFAAPAAARLLRFAPLGLGMAYLGIGLSGAWVGALLFVLGEAVCGLLDPVYNARLNELIPDAQRATVLSMQNSGVSMLMMIAFPAASYLQPVTSIYVATGAAMLAVAAIWTLGAAWRLEAKQPGSIDTAGPG